MAALSPSSRLRGKRRSAQLNSAINITPLVDVMLVLLVIFMIAAPMLTVGVPVDLPKTEAAKMNDETEPLVVSVNEQGKIYLQETELPLEGVLSRLVALAQNKKEEVRIYVRGDKSLSYGRIMEIMGSIAAAGFTKVSLIAELPTEPKKSR